MSGRTIGFAVTGSFCTHEKIKKVIEELVNQGEKVIPVFSPICQHTDSRFGKCEDFIKDIQKITKQKGIFTIPEAEPIGPKALLDVLVIADQWSSEYLPMTDWELIFKILAAS